MGDRFQFPPPRDIDDEAAERIVREARRMREAFEKLTRPMEEISGEDLQTRVR